MPGAGRRCMRGSASAQGPVVDVDDPRSRRRSPQSLLFGYVAAFMYEGDSPIAERRAAALTLDQGLLAELLGRAELRELLDPDVLAEVEAELQRLADDRRARDAEGVADLLRLLGPLTTDEVAGRAPTGPTWRSLARRRWPTPAAWSRSGSPASRGGPSSRTSAGCATGSACRCRPAPRTRSPSRSPTRWPTWSPATPAPTARSRAAEVAARLGLGVAVAQQTLVRLGAQGRVLEGEFRPAGVGRGVVRRRGAAQAPAPFARRGSATRSSRSSRRRSAGSCRRGSTSRPATGGRLRGPDGVLAVVEQLAGCAGPGLGARAAGAAAAGSSTTSPAYLDELTATGEVLWAGHGGLPGADGWVSLHLADSAPLTLPEPATSSSAPRPPGRARRARRRRRLLLPPARPTARARTDDKALGALVWDLVWAGRLGNDTLAPLRGAHPVGHAAPTGPVARRPEPGSPRPRGRGTADPQRARRHRRPLVAAARARARPDPARARRRRGPARPARRRHPRRGHERADARVASPAVYKVLSAFEELRPLPPRLLRRRAGRRPVRHRRRRRPAALATLRRSAPPGQARRRVDAGGDRPGQPVRRRAALAGATASATEPPGHRPGRKAGALVVLVDGELALYVERGGRTLLTFADDDATCSRPRSTRSAPPCAGARSAGSPWRRPTASTSSAADSDADPREALEAAGFVADAARAATARRGIRA